MAGFFLTRAGYRPDRETVKPPNAAGPGTHAAFRGAHLFRWSAK